MRPSSTDSRDRFRTIAVTPFTLVECIIAASVMAVLALMVVRVTVLGWSQIQKGQAQLNYQAQARHGTERIMSTVNDGRTVSVDDGGDTLVIYNEDDSLIAFRFVDEDGDPVTTSDNRILHDPDLEFDGDESVVLSHVTKDAEAPVFRIIGKSVAILYHVGDPPDVCKADHISGEGYQGLSVRVVAKPRNIGNVWTVNMDL